MIKRITTVKLCLVLFFLLNISLIAGEGYDFEIDLVNVVDDRVQVTLIPPDFNTSEVIYRMPRIVPGTYTVYDFGRFIKDFKVFDKSGNEIPSERIDINSWRIPGAMNVGRITYWVDDTFDSRDTGKFVFEPAGTNIENDEIFLINTHGFFGYFDNMKRLNYNLTFLKPEGFYGSTAIKADVIGFDKDSYTVSDYYLLADSPIMYNIPDTTILNVGGAEILVSVYAKNKIHNSKIVAENIRKILNATKNYLGGTLPIDKYAFLFYFHKGFSSSGGDGALEHSYSSVYSLPDIAPEFLSKHIDHIAAHEFLHIITPLNIHSEQIHDFDFNDPEMSRHLWLYEGVTEYVSNLIQVREGLIPTEEFLEEMRTKISNSRKYNDALAFTELSRDVLGKYKDEFMNVYMKGALIGMALDLKLRELTGGSYGLPDLVSDLSKRYGKNKPFRDVELFDVIAEISHPGIRSFFTDYVEGNNPLPYKDIFALAGIEYLESGEGMDYSLGGLKLGLNPITNRITVASIDNLDSFGRSLGFKEGDEIIKFNDEELNLNNFGEIVNSYFMAAQEGDDFQIEVIRESSSGSRSNVILSAKLKKVVTEMEHVLQIDPDATPEQVKIRNAWLKQ
jgi:predicted metalloprotease with PDZ domain